MLALGIDIGGTAIKAGLVNQKGKIISEKTIKTEVHEGQNKIIRKICNVAVELASEGKKELTDLAGVGLGVPGFVNYDEGRVLLAPNLKWKNTSLKSILEQELKLPTFLDNDVNAAALGERYFGAAKDCENFIMLTVGTGLGGALYLNGNIYRGINGMAGEIGHMIVEKEGSLCGCGQRGCLETLTSATAMLNQAKENGIDVEEAKEIFLLARLGNKKAIQVIETSAYYLGLGIINLVNLLNVKKVIVGGGVSQGGEIYFEPIRRTVKELGCPSLVKDLKIIPALLGNKAGILGASSLVLRGEKD